MKFIIYESQTNYYIVEAESLEALEEAIENDETPNILFEDSVSCEIDSIEEYTDD